MPSYCSYILSISMYCIVKNCLGNKGGSNEPGIISFHSFPRNEILCNKWLISLGLEKFAPKNHDRICSRHFKPQDFHQPFVNLTTSKRRNLLPGAIPYAAPEKGKQTTQDAVPILPKVLNVDREVEATLKENVAAMLDNLQSANANLRKVNRRLQVQLDAKATVCGACVQFRAERDFLFRKLEDITNKGSVGRKCTDVADCPHQRMFSDAVKEIGRLNEVISQLAQQRIQNNAANEGMQSPGNAEMPSWTGQRESPPLEPETNLFEAIVPKQEPPDVPDMSEENEYILPDAGEEEEVREPEIRVVAKVKQELQTIPENTFGDCVVPINEYRANDNERVAMNEKARFYSIASSGIQSMSEAIEAAKKHTEKQKLPGEQVAVPQTEAVINPEQTENLAMVTRPMILKTSFGHFYVTPGVVQLKKVKKTKPVHAETTGKDLEQRAESSSEIGHAASCEVVMAEDEERATKEIRRVEEDSDDAGKRICKWLQPGGVKICGCKLKTRDGLARHAKRHVITYPNSCYKCRWKDCPKNNIVFRSKIAVKSHMRTHISERSVRTFRCQLPGCHSTYSDAEALMAHNETHGKFKCKHLGCGKTFENSVSRAQHYQGHHPRMFKSVKCSFADCGQAFQNIGLYVKHIRDHGGEKPLPCPFEECGERFAFKTALKQHMLTHEIRKTE